MKCKKQLSELKSVRKKLDYLIRQVITDSAHGWEEIADADVLLSRAEKKLKDKC